jgi:hypothetical protein
MFGYVAPNCRISEGDRRQLEAHSAKATSSVAPQEVDGGQERTGPAEKPILLKWTASALVEEIVDEFLLEPLTVLMRHMLLEPLAQSLA